MQEKHLDCNKFEDVDVDTIIPFYIRFIQDERQTCLSKPTQKNVALLQSLANELRLFVLHCHVPIRLSKALLQHVFDSIVLGSRLFQPLIVGYSKLLQILLSRRPKQLPQFDDLLDLLLIALKEKKCVHPETPKESRLIKSAELLELCRALGELLEACPSGMSAHLEQIAESLHEILFVEENLESDYAPVLLDIFAKIAHESTLSDLPQENRFALLIKIQKAVPDLYRLLDHRDFSIYSPVINLLSLLYRAVIHYPHAFPNFRPVTQLKLSTKMISYIGKYDVLFNTLEGCQSSGTRRTRLIPQSEEPLLADAFYEWYSDCLYIRHLQHRLKKTEPATKKVKTDPFLVSLFDQTEPFTAGSLVTMISKYGSLISSSDTSALLDHIDQTPLNKTSIDLLLTILLHTAPNPRYSWENVAEACIRNMKSSAPLLRVPLLLSTLVGLDLLQKPSVTAILDHIFSDSSDRSDTKYVAYQIDLLISVWRWFGRVEGYSERTGNLAPKIWAYICSFKDVESLKSLFDAIVKHLNGFELNTMTRQQQILQEFSDPVSNSSVRPLIPRSSSRVPVLRASIPIILQELAREDLPPFCVFFFAYIFDRICDIPKDSFKNGSIFFDKIRDRLLSDWHGVHDLAAMYIRDLESAETAETSLMARIYQGANSYELTNLESTDAVLKIKLSVLAAKFHVLSLIGKKEDFDGEKVYSFRAVQVNPGAILSLTRSALKIGNTGKHTLGSLV